MITLYRCRECGVANEAPSTYQTVRGAHARCPACGVVVTLSTDEAEALAAARLFTVYEDEDDAPVTESPADEITGVAFGALIALAAAFALALWLA